MNRAVDNRVNRAVSGSVVRAVAQRPDRVDRADRAAILLLTAYQRALSPAFAALGSQCRFEPSCSQYMIDAVRSRGAAAGLALGLWRLLRCNPLNRGGYDPAPAPASSQDVSRETI